MKLARLLRLRVLIVILPACFCACLYGFGMTGHSQSSLDLRTCSISEMSDPVKCGSLDVYEDREKNAGRVIVLNVVVVPALISSPTPDPIFWLEGGPGAAASQSAVVVSQKWLRGLHEDHDLVFVDQRGTGKSGALKCDDIGEDPKNPDAFFGKPFPRELISTCRKTLEKSADLRDYTTSIAMDDLDDVRKALGYDKIDLAALSYGTLAAQVYMRQHPDHVRAAFLLGVVTPDYKQPLPFAAASQSAIEQVWNACAADTKCHRAFPNLEQEFREVLGRFSNGPLKVDIFDLETRESKAVLLERDSYVEHLRAMLYSTWSARFIPYVIHQAYSGNFVPFGILSVRFNLGGPSASRGMQFSVLCSESVPFISRKEAALRSRDSFLGDSRVEAYERVCEEWPRAKVPRSFLELVRTTTPILAFAGEADGVTPPKYVAAAKMFWPNGKVVIIPRSGHQLDSPCEYNLIEAFFRAGSAEALDASCVEHIQRPAFIISMPMP